MFDGEKHNAISNAPPSTRQHIVNIMEPTSTQTQSTTPSSTNQIRYNPLSLPRFSGQQPTPGNQFPMPEGKGTPLGSKSKTTDP